MSRIDLIDILLLFMGIIFFLLLIAAEFSRFYQALIFVAFLACFFGVLIRTETRDKDDFN